MALDFSKFGLKFFDNMSGRTRILLLVGAVAGMLLLVYLGTVYFYGGTSSLGPSKVAEAPQNLQSVPGSELTPEYYRALSQANTQTAERAQRSGSSAVPTLIAENQQGGITSGAGCVICSDQSADVKILLDGWVKQGTLDADTSEKVLQFVKKYPPPEGFANLLDQLVKNTKLTPDQARQLLEEYRKQYLNHKLKASEEFMDNMIKAGQLPIVVANELLTAQKNGELASDYAKRLQGLVSDGRLSAQAAQQLLIQYTQLRAKEIIAQSVAILELWSQQGQIIPEILNQLTDLENKMVALETFKAEVQTIVQQGKLAPVIADKIVAEYRQQKAAMGPTGATNDIVTRAENKALQTVISLVGSGQISQDTAQQITDLIKSGISPDQFNDAIANLVKDNKLSADAGKQIITDYQRVILARQTAGTLNSLQANNAPTSQYAEALRRAVAVGVITPDQAAELMQQYQAITSRTVAPVTPTEGSSEFAELQRNLQRSGAGDTAVATATEFQTQPDQSGQPGQSGQLQGNPASDQAHMERIQNLISAMSGQADRLVSAWQPAQMVHKEGEPDKSKTNSANAEGSGGSGSAPGSSSSSLTAPPASVLIKAGSVIFAVLDTAVNSDYPDSPVMATIVEGPYKGARLLGKLMTQKSVSGQLDRISLNFQLMNLDAWPQSKSVTAYAIDPDTARTVMASSVNYHYMLRFGAIMATSFMQGYAQAVNNSGSTTGIGLNGTQTQTTSQFSPTDKIALAIGQIGQTLSAVTQNYVNIPPTVRVDSGVSLGILFMADVS